MSLFCPTTIERDYDLISDKEWIADHISCTNEFSVFKNELVQILSESECFLEGHFKLLSGQHSKHFLRLQKITRKVKFYKPIAAQFSYALKKRGIGFNALLSPDTAGSFFAYGIQQEYPDKEISMYISRTDSLGRPTKETNYIEAGEDSKVVIVYDMATTGQGLKKLLEISEEKELDVQCVVLFANKEPQNLDIRSIVDESIPLIQMCDINFPEDSIWDNEEVCPLCRI